MQASPQESTSASPPSIWRNTGDMTPPDPGSMLFFWTVLMIVVMVPAWGAVLGLISLLELAKGVPVSFIETIQAPIFLWSMLISVLMLPVMLACMSMTPTVMQFDRIGHLELVVPDRKARRRPRHIHMVFGRLIPLTELAELGALLRPYLGERMHDLHELDQ